jgi:hypothetical protein
MHSHRDPFDDDLAPEIHTFFRRHSAGDTTSRRVILLGGRDVAEYRTDSGDSPCRAACAGVAERQTQWIQNPALTYELILAAQQSHNLNAQQKGETRVSYVLLNLASPIL